MRTFTQEELNEIIILHKLWVEGNPKGVRANLRNVDLRYADLRNADLRYANLRNVDLRNVDLRNADLHYADLRYAKNLFIPIACPEEGAFIGFKKASNYIVVLEIPEDAKRCSATSRKCRCSKAKVLRIEDCEGNVTNRKTVRSSYDRNFIYTVGKTVEVENFEEDRFKECSAGIHFFITRQEAIDY